MDPVLFTGVAIASSQASRVEAVAGYRGNFRDSAINSAGPPYVLIGIL